MSARLSGHVKALIHVCVEDRSQIGSVEPFAAGVSRRRIRYENFNKRRIQVLIRFSYEGVSP